ncbi:hypothetical protein [Desulfatibacillum aliphaticivorans]|uniref:hypothetical protein n=1 Tax=Desulfatibacillum aliphaticivorans TaxID=218208 RepID=UPI00042858FB|nr:hypothetical protein [Desulfatibacillum aliphaticivorans]
MIDVTVSFKRYSFLGLEFLTWLWWATEEDPEQIAKAAGEPAVLYVGNRIVLEKRQREDVERVTIKGDAAQMDEGVLALKKGAQVKDVNLVMEIGDQKWTFNLNGETMAFSTLKTPPTAPVRVVDEMEGAIIEKAALLEKPINVIHNIFSHFIKIRISEGWREELLKVRKWITEFQS